MWWAQHCWAFGSEELDELQDKCFPFSKWSWYCAAVIKEIRGQTNGRRFSRQKKWRRSQILEIHGRAQAVERLQIEGLLESFIFFLEEQKGILLEVRPVMGSLSVPWMIGEWIRRFDGKMNDSDKSVPVLIFYDKSDVDYPGNQTGHPRIKGAYQLPLLCINEQKLAVLATCSKCYHIIK
jgi:hypothetical protein